MLLVRLLVLLLLRLLVLLLLRVLVLLLLWLLVLAVPAWAAWRVVAVAAVAVLHRLQRHVGVPDASRRDGRAGPPPRPTGCGRGMQIASNRVRRANRCSPRSRCTCRCLPAWRGCVCVCQGLV